MMSAQPNRLSQLNVNIQRELHKQIRILAMEEDKPLRQVVQEALRLRITQSEGATPKKPILTPDPC